MSHGRKDGDKSSRRHPIAISDDLMPAKQMHSWTRPATEMAVDSQISQSIEAESRRHSTTLTFRFEIRHPEGY
jgi:hypothetical protein